MLSSRKELCFSYVKIDFLITELDGKALVACIGFHSQDFCLLTEGNIEEIKVEVESKGIEIEVGIVQMMAQKNQALMN